MPFLKGKADVIVIFYANRTTQRRRLIEREGMHGYMVFSYIPDLPDSLPVIYIDNSDGYALTPQEMEDLFSEILERKRQFCLGIGGMN